MTTQSCKACGGVVSPVAEHAQGLIREGGRVIAHRSLARRQTTRAYVFAIVTDVAVGILRVNQCHCGNPRPEE